VQTRQLSSPREVQQIALQQNLLQLQTAMQNASQSTGKMRKKESQRQHVNAA
jgi:hypothetical protein